MLLAVLPLHAAELALSHAIDLELSEAVVSVEPFRHLTEVLDVEDGQPETVFEETHHFMVGHARMIGVPTLPLLDRAHEHRTAGSRMAIESILLLLVVIWAIVVAAVFALSSRRPRRKTAFY